MVKPCLNPEKRDKKARVASIAREKALIAAQRICPLRTKSSHSHPSKGADRDRRPYVDVGVDIAAIGASNHCESPVLSLFDFIGTPSSPHPYAHLKVRAVVGEHHDSATHNPPSDACSYANDAPTCSSQEPQAPSLPERPSRKKHRQTKKHQIQRPIRAAERAKIQEAETTTLKKSALNHVAQCLPVDVSAYESSELRHVKTAWTGKKLGLTAKDQVQIPDSFEYVRWNPSNGDSALLVDAKGRVFSAMATGPKGALGKDWDDVCNGCVQALECASTECGFGSTDVDPLRGNFPAFAMGITRGPGSDVPSMRVHKKKRFQAAFLSLLRNPYIRRVAGYQSMQLHAHAPKLGEYYRQTLNALIQHDHTLHCNFDNSDFASITFNFGPHTICKVHVDSLNLAWGWCAITAFGNYDHTRGGHLVLWDLCLVIEFPPGCTILIPSAALRHSNTPIQAHERRYSVTQYSGGQLFHWVHDGFRPACKTTVAEGASRWENGINMYAHI